MRAVLQMKHWPLLLKNRGSLGNLGGREGKMRCGGRGQTVGRNRAPFYPPTTKFRTKEHVCLLLKGSEGPLTPNKDGRNGGIS